jgi:hypothetical protein
MNAVAIRQGDVLLVPVGELPTGAQVQEGRVGIRIAGERTGHAHELIGSVAVDGDREYVLGGNTLTHQEHRHHVTEPVWYEVRLQREHVAQQQRQRWD